MGHKNKGPKPSTKPQTEIKVTDTSKVSTQLVISYKHFNDNKKYSMSTLTDNRLRIQKEDSFRRKLKEYCEYSNFKKKISEEPIFRKANHIHQIEWDDNRIREKYFTSINNNLMEQIKDDCWQLGIDNQGFRIHGFFIDNVFYIVWLDPEHSLYERK